MIIRGKDIRDGGGIHRGRVWSTKLHLGMINANVLQHNQVATGYYDLLQASK